MSKSRVRWRRRRWSRRWPPPATRPARWIRGAAADAAARRQAAELQGLRRALIVAAVFALPVFVLEMGSHMIPAFHHAVAGSIGVQNSWYIQFVLASIVLFGPGLRFFRKGCRRCCAARPT